MYRKNIFIFIHQLYDKNFLKLYKKIQSNLNKPYEQLKEEQEQQLRKMINFCYEQVPYYTELFDSLNLKPQDFQKIKDLKKLPILKKQTIKENFERFKPKNLKSIKYYNIATGGTSGNPFNYRVCKEHRTRAGALLYRGWSYGGYELGDKIFFLAGASLNAGSKYGWLTKIHEFTRNTRFLSSFDMQDRLLLKYANLINKEKPKFIRGYPSAIGYFAEFIIKNSIKINTPIRAVFTTSELLQPKYREAIEVAFRTKVFDGYGLNDGGVTANECNAHKGLHIDTENAVLEVVDEKDNTINGGTGRIIATSLFNFALPFIRYETEDLAEVSEDSCTCGKKTKLIKKIIGRKVDILYAPDGKAVHGWFFLYIFWKYGKGFDQYQIIQKDISNITIKYVANNFFHKSVLEEIYNTIKLNVPDWRVVFKEVELIEKTKSGKQKFIINNLSDSF